MTEKSTKNEKLPIFQDHFQKRKLSRNHFFWIILISFLGSAIYFQTFNYKYTGDDGIYTYFNNATQQGLKGTKDLFKYGSMNFLNVEPTNSGTYRPFTLFTFALEKQIVGDFNPTYGHIINIALYFLLLIFVGLLLVQLFSLKNIPVIVPLLILLIYAVHPLHIEVVASIKSRDTLLSSLLSFSAVYVWLQSNRKTNIWIDISFGMLFFLALLSKEESLTIIAVVFLISWFFLNENFTKSFKHTTPFLIAGVIYLIIRQIILYSPTSTYNNILNNIIYATQGQERFATNLYIYLYYIKLLVFPHPLSWDYSFNQISIKTLSDGWVLLSFVFFISIIYVAFKGFRKRKIISFSILFFFVTFSIFSNFTPSITIGSTLAERFMFIPSLGFCIFLVYGLYLLLEKFRFTKQTHVLISILFLITFAYSAKSYTRVPVWKDNLTLGYSGINDSPKSWRTHMILADELRQQAVRLTTDTLVAKINSDTSKVVFQKAVNHYNKGYYIIGDKAKQFTFLQGLGECYLHLRDTVSAKITFLKAVENPNLFYGLFKLGMISFNEKDYQTAVNYYQKALRANSPDFFSTYKNLAGSYQMLKDYEKAIEAYEKAREYGSSDEIISNLSFLYASLGNMEKAKSLKPIDSKISEEEIYFKQSIEFGKVAYSKNNYTKAKQYFEKCFPYFDKYGGSSKYPEFLNAYAHSLLQTNETSRAKTIFKRVADENPKNYFALKNLGFISFQYDKNYANAIQFYNQSLQANSPDYFQSYSNLGTLYLVQKLPEKAIENYELALRYGSSPTILDNLFLLWKSKGNQEKMAYYQELIKSNVN